MKALNMVYSLMEEILGSKAQRARLETLDNITKEAKKATETAKMTAAWSENLKGLEELSRAITPRYVIKTDPQPNVTNHKSAHDGH